MSFKECANSNLGTLFLYRQCKLLRELLSRAPSPNKTDLAVHLELLFLFKENLLLGKPTENDLSNSRLPLQEILFSSYLQIFRLLQFIVVSETERAGMSLIQYEQVQTGSDAEGGSQRSAV